MAEDVNRYAGRLTARWLPVAMSVFVLVLAATLRNDGAVLTGKLFDPDVYMRAVRVLQLLRTGDWFDSTIAQANAPFGDALHWTRPFDVLMLAVAAPMLPFLSDAQAIYLTAMFVSPILYLVALPALYWAARPLLDREGQFYLGILFLFQVATAGQFLVGRGDHHSLLCLLFIVQLGQALRLLGERPTGRLVAAAGLTTALTVWVSPEGLVAAALIHFGLGVHWLLSGAATRRGLGHAAGTVVGIAVALVIERPPADWLAVEYDKISVFHLLLFSLLALFWIAAAGPWQRWPLRFALGAAGAAGIAAVVLLLFPNAVKGPLAALEPRVAEVWFTVISEAQGAIDLRNPSRTLSRLLLNLGPILIAVPMLLHLLRTTDGAARRQWAWLALALAVYTGLALDELRWLYYPQICFLPPFAAALMWLLSRLGLRQRPPDATPRQARRIVLGRPATVVVFGLLFFGLAALVPGDEADAGAGDGCDLAGTARLLSAPPLGDRRRNIMSFNFTTSEFIYRTRHAYVATPYHRNAAGILDGYDFFSTTDPDRAWEIARRRDLDLGVFCPASREHAMYEKEGAETMLDRLSDGNPPPWLSPMPVDPGLGYLIYEIRK